MGWWTDEANSRPAHTCRAQHQPPAKRPPAQRPGAWFCAATSHAGYSTCRVASSGPSSATRGHALPSWGAAQTWKRAGQAVDARAVSCQRSDEWWCARLEVAMRGGRGKYRRLRRKSHRDAALRRWRCRCRGGSGGICQDHDGADRAIVGGNAYRNRRSCRGIRSGCRWRAVVEGSWLRGFRRPRNFCAMDVSEQECELDRERQHCAPRSGPNVRSNPTHFGGLPWAFLAQSIPPGARKCIKL